jgi:hypothetical protein
MGDYSPLNESPFGQLLRVKPVPVEKIERHNGMMLNGKG